MSRIGESGNQPPTLLVSWELLKELIQLVHRPRSVSHRVSYVLSCAVPLQTFFLKQSQCNPQLLVSDLAELGRPVLTQGQLKTQNLFKMSLCDCKRTFQIAHVRLWRKERGHNQILNLQLIKGSGHFGLYHTAAPLPLRGPHCRVTHSSLTLPKAGFLFLYF